MVLQKNILSIIKTVLTGVFRKTVYPYQFIKNNTISYVEIPKFDITNPNASHNVYHT